MSQYRIMDESELPAAPKKGGRWVELRHLLDELPEGKWVEVPVADGELATSLGTCIQQNFRIVQAGYKISYRRDLSGRRLFVTKRPSESEKGKFA